MSHASTEDTLLGNWRQALADLIAGGKHPGMTKVAAGQDVAALNVATSKAFVSLINDRSTLDITPGLHLVVGGTGSGKTTVMAALALYMANEFSKIRAYRINEGLFVDPGSLQVYYWPHSEPGGDSVPVSPEVLCNGINAVSESSVLIVDSMTYDLPAIGSAIIPPGVENVTMKGGTRWSDVLACRYVDNLARVGGRAVYGVLNADLFPKTNELEGACEGIMRVESVSGVITYRNRFRRQTSTFVVPEAREVLSALYGTRVLDDNTITLI